MQFRRHPRRPRGIVLLVVLAMLSVMALLGVTFTAFARNVQLAAKNYRLAEQGQMAAFRHEGFWHPMDTLREKEHLEALWSQPGTPWKIW